MKYEDLKLGMQEALTDSNGNLKIGALDSNHDSISAILNTATLASLKTNIAGANTQTLKAYKWASITHDSAITQTNLAGIVIIGSGTLTLIGSDDAELNLGTLTADPTVILPFCPKKTKAGSTATVYAVYGA